MTGLTNFSELRALLAREGIRTAYIKKLSPKQDNEKNQIYFGSKLPGLINLFPAKLSYREGSTSTTKRKSKVGKPIMEASRVRRALVSVLKDRLHPEHQRVLLSLAPTSKVPLRCPSCMPSFPVQGGWQQ